jgi:hypothetical protein
MNEFQCIAKQAYAGGRFANVGVPAGDPLFDFIFTELADADSHEDAIALLEQAIRDIETVRDALLQA